MHELPNSTIWLEVVSKMVLMMFPVQACDFSSGTIPRFLAEIGFRIPAIELSRADQAVDGRGALATSIRSGKKIVFTTERNGTE